MVIFFNREADTQANEDNRRAGPGMHNALRKAREAIEDAAARVHPEQFHKALTMALLVDGLFVFDDEAHTGPTEAIKFETFVNGENPSECQPRSGAATPHDAIYALREQVVPYVTGKTLLWRIYPTIRQDPDGGKFYARCRCAAFDADELRAKLEDAADANDPGRPVPDHGSGP